MRVVCGEIYGKRFKKNLPGSPRIVRSFAGLTPEAFLRHAYADQAPTKGQRL